MNSTEAYIRQEIDATLTRIDECIQQIERWNELANFFEDHLTALREKLGDVALIDEVASITPIHERRLEVVPDNEGA